MNCFTLTAVGNLARNPELVSKGDLTYTRFLLVGTDYRRDEDGSAREFVTSLWFTAFGALGEFLADRALKGDQLIIQAHVRANNWIDKHGERQYDHSFVVDGFRFGAPGKLKREELDARRGEEVSRGEARRGDDDGDGEARHSEALGRSEGTRDGDEDGEAGHDNEAVRHRDDETVMESRG